ncbi:diguanylate cyclase [Candidatus Woesearchaeota archaeon]|nr:diguanylate cyclase [Candidatus Woesearchaeota archaeon]
MAAMNIIHSNGKSTVRPKRISAEDKPFYSIIIVDDEYHVRNSTKMVLKKAGYERLYTASSASELEQLLEKTEPHLILMDLNLGKSPHDGLDLMKRIDEERLAVTDYIVISGERDHNLIGECMAYAIDFMEKTFSISSLLARVENALINREFRSMAITDSMTRVANKGTFLDQLQYHVALFDRSKHPLSLVMMDIDHFKSYNDTFGHLEGDSVIKEAANFYSSHLRATDLFARYGGEEFGIIMPETPFEGALSTFERLHRDFKQIIFNPKEGVKKGVTFSAGISTLDVDSYELLQSRINLRSSEGRIEMTNRMITSADQALYHVKERGRNGCCPDNYLVGNVV